MPSLLRAACALLLCCCASPAFARGGGVAIRDLRPGDQVLAFEDSGNYLLHWYYTQKRAM